MIYLLPSPGQESLLKLSVIEWNLGRLKISKSEAKDKSIILTMGKDPIQVMLNLRPVT